MNKEEILNKYIDLIDKGYCSDCNELNYIDNFPHAKITHAIRELQKENKKYKEVIDKAIDYVENEMPYLQETDKEYEDVNGNTYFTYKEYDGKELIEILKGVE